MEILQVLKELLKLVFIQIYQAHKHLYIIHIMNLFRIQLMV